MSYFEDMQNAAKHLREVYEMRAKHLNEMVEHLREAEVWLSGISKIGLSPEPSHQQFQRMRFEYMMKQMCDDMERLQGIHFIEIDAGTTMAAATLEVLKHVDTHGFPIGGERC